MKWLLTVLLLLLPMQGQANTIILLVDISSSINDEDFELQMSGYANAMMNIGPLQYFDLEVVTFHDEPRLISSGSNKAAALAFADHPRTPSQYRGSTCMTDALEFVEAMIPSVRHPVILDISGDGQANCRSDMGLDRLNNSLDRMAAQGVRINTLFVKTAITYDKHYTADEITDAGIAFYRNLERNGGFTIIADDFRDFEEALFKKLVFEMVQVVE